MSKGAKHKKRPRTTLDNIPDSLLERIIALNATSVSVVRAAATCRRLRRLVTGTGFDSAQNLFGPYPRYPMVPVAGNYHNQTDGRGTIYVPSSPALNNDVVDIRHFSLDFLPGGGGRSWEVVDSSASVLLLAKKKTGWRRRCFPDLAVCEPVTRSYKLIPPLQEMKYHRCVGAFLSHGAESRHGRASMSLSTWLWTSSSRFMSTFRVTCVVYDGYAGISEDVGTARACVFDRSLFWGIKYDDKSLLVYDGEHFRKFELPSHVRGSALRIVDIGDYNKFWVICVQDSALLVFDAPSAGGTDEWELVNRLELVEAARGLAGYDDKYFGDGLLKIVMADMRSVVLTPVAKTWMFSVNLDTMDVAALRYKTGDPTCAAVAYPYELPWPPVFRACKLSCIRYGGGPCSNFCKCY
ncbi:unnamed protein product [Alopecurus aequalis]